MCGIAGIISFRGSSVDMNLIHKMTDTIYHRGPDDFGYYHSPTFAAALGSRRLSIIDLSHDGQMPMSNEREDVWVVFNGEIYNHAYLRHELKMEGHYFKSKTDTEVIIHGYEEYNLDFVNKLSGMFAFALWDEKLHKLILARDRVGEKPLYFCSFREQFIFASEIKSIILNLEIDRKIELSSLMQYLTYGFVMPPKTLFSGIYKLAPGEMLTIDKHNAITLRRYWTPYQDKESILDIKNRTIEDHAKEIRRLLEKSVFERLVADVPVGAFLSGGLDSSAVVAIMARTCGHPVETVTVAYPMNPESDETSFAKLLATRVGASYHEVTIRENEVIDIFRQSIYHLDEPLSDPACINTYLAAKYFRDMGVVVSLVGEGADELFLGYPTYLKYQKLMRFWRINRNLPTCLRRIEYKIFARTMTILGLNTYLDPIRRAMENETIFLSTWTNFPDVDKWPLLNPMIRSAARQWPAHKIAGEVQDEIPNELIKDTLLTMGYTDFKMQLAEKFLMRVDKASMAHSIEIRAPFLDPQLVQYALSIPGKTRALNGQTKHLLRLAVKDLIPQEILQRPKMGFSTPIISWFKNGLGLYFEHKMKTSKIFQEGIMSSHHCKKLLEEHRKGLSLNHDKLWNILALVEWYDLFNIEGYKDIDGSNAFPNLIS